MEGDNALYIRDDASEACWEYLDPAIKAFADNDFPLHTYKKEPWGPQATDTLIASAPDSKWRNVL